jgi:hypothetical protein
LAGETFPTYFTKSGGTHTSWRRQNEGVLVSRFRPFADIRYREILFVYAGPTSQEGDMGNRNLIVLAIAATVACYLLADRSQTDGIIGFYRETLSGPMFTCWLAGLVAATISPAACAVFFWSTAKRFRRGWILHLLLVPAIYGLDQLCTALMLFAADEPDLDSLTGHALLPATLLFMICPIIYFAGLCVRKIGERRRFASAG